MFILKFLFLLLVFTTIAPKNAFAYLDPGSGSALFTSIIAIATAGFYSLKMLYYKLIGKSISNTTSDNTMVIFSEGKSYWGTFEPLVTELIKQKIHFRYVSLDIFDPALEIESEFMHSKLYPKSSAGFGKLSAIKSPVMLATTPNIGSDGYPFPRPKNVGNLIHVFHSMTDSSNYRLGALDYYDSVIMMAEHQEKYLRHVENERNIKAKEMIALGLPYLDNLYHKLKEEKLDNNLNSNTILIAPSWGDKGCFNYFGTEFVKDLSEKGYNIIIRLHPHSAIYEPENVAKWHKELSSLNNLVWDNDVYSTNAMNKANILVSDTSSVRFDFAFLHLKPVITLHIPLDSLPEFEGVYHKTTWDMEVAHDLGAVIEKSNINNLTNEISNILSTFDSNKILKIRDENIKNFGNSAKYIISFLQEKSNNKGE